MFDTVDAEFADLVTDLPEPDWSALLDIGKHSYRRPSDCVTSFSPDSVCCFPTCNQPGHRCEFEHIIAFNEGGQTCRCGGALACKRHNLCKINTGWHYRRLPDGSDLCTDDTGHKYPSHPPQRWQHHHDRPAVDHSGPLIIDGGSRAQVLQPGRLETRRRTISDVPPPPAPRRASGQDSCPGAIRVHQAADGGLARVRVPGGMLTGQQWQTLIAAAQELGNGRLELTSRGNLQLRGLGVGDEIPLGTRLADAGLLPSPTHERVRNLLVSPLTGRDRAGLLDLRPLIAEFDRALCARPVLRELSGRFLFALDDGRGDVLACEPDIALTPEAADSLQLLLAGQPTGLRAPASAAVTLLLAAAEAFLAERAEQGGNAWRLAELTDGPARVAARLDAPGPATGVAPANRARPHRRSSVVANPAAGSPPAPGRLTQADGRTALVVGIPLGSLTATQATVLTRPQLILTPWRSVVLPDLAAELATELSTACTGLGLITDPASPLVGVTACTGRPGCASALADVRADALAMHHAGAKMPAAGVHWSGCGRRCGRPATTVTDLVATGSGYRLHLGDRTVDLSELSEISTVLAAAR